MILVWDRSLLLRLLALVLLVACNRRTVERMAEPTATRTQAFTVTIHEPSRLQRLSLGSLHVADQGQSSLQHPSTTATAPGRANAVNCETCHSLRTQNTLPESMQELDEFHQGIVLNHGALRCAACHASGQPPRLHLADGQMLERADALLLCRQCHGPQYRDYEHGAHGGMSGYWDLSKGPRTRNHCVDCHDPHWPAIQQVLPAPGPRDRFFYDAPRHDVADTSITQTDVTRSSAAASSLQPGAAP